MAIANARSQQFSEAPNTGLPGPNGQTPLPALISRALNCLQGGDANGALRILATAPREASGDAFACRAFSLIYLSANDYPHAIEWFDYALRLNEKSPEALSGKGTALQGSGRLNEAISCFDQALTLQSSAPETWYNRGVALDALGDVAAALLSYDTALAQRPDYPHALARRSAALAKLGRLEEALSAANALVGIAAEDGADAWCLRGNMLQELGRYSDAIAAYNQTLALRSNYPAALINRATAYNEVGRTGEALRDLNAALAIEPDQPEALVVRGNVLQTVGRNAEAQDDYRRSLALRPLITHPAVTKEPEFLVLFIFAPISGNTPIDDMISFSNFESNMLMLLPGVEYDIDFLRSKADVVFNLVSDVDRSAVALDGAADLVARLGKPLVNPPFKVLLTERDRISQLLANIDGCLVPSTKRYTRDALLADIGAQSLSVSLPLIARVAGTHGGDAMELANDLQELQMFVSSREAPEYYLSEFIDYRSDDGFFRKYRFIFVGGEILPYHLAIDDTWKVHHASTDMGAHPWMQEEEKVFLERSETVVSSTTWKALRVIRDELNLDYFGIDCAFDSDGKVIVFEVNASMLVHLHNERFPYKNAPVRRIKAAFAAMLRAKASGGAVNA